MALRRLRNPLRISLPKLRSLDLILEDDAWIIVDRELNDIPVLAWLDFETKSRGLHEPVVCKLNLYHAHGLIIVEKAMEAMALLIGEQLAEAYPEEVGGIAVLKKKKKNSKP